MIFTVKLDHRKFSSLMKGKSDYIDVLTKNREVTFMVYDTGTMSSCVVPVVTCEDYEDDVYFRLPTKIFLNFLTDDLVEFSITDTSVFFKFLQKKSSEHYKFEVRKQVVNFERFERLLHVRDQVRSGKFAPLDLNELMQFIKLAYYVGGIVHSDGSVFYCSTHNVQLYQETTFRPGQALSIYAKDLLMLSKHGESVWNIENMVVSVSDEFIVIVDKVRPTMVSDYNFLVGRKSKKKYTVNLVNALTAIKKLNYGSTNAEVNFTNKLCRLEAENCELTVPISVENTGDSVDSLEDFMKQVDKPQKEVKIFLSKMQSGLLFGIKSSMIFDIFRDFVKITITPKMFVVISRSV